MRRGASSCARKWASPDVTFTHWLRMQRERTDDVGAFARDALADPTWPHRSRKHDTFEWYLLSTGASTRATEAFEQAYAEWSRVNDGEDVG